MKMDDDMKMDAENEELLENGPAHAKSEKKLPEIA